MATDQLKHFYCWSKTNIIPIYIVHPYFVNIVTNVFLTERFICFTENYSSMNEVNFFTLNCINKKIHN